MGYRYKTTYLKVPYLAPETKGIGIGKLRYGQTTLPPLEPDIDTIYQSGLYQSHLDDVSSDNWELVSVVPILRAVMLSAEGGRGRSEAGGTCYSLTDGLQFYWRQEKAR